MVETPNIRDSRRFAPGARNPSRGLHITYLAQAFGTLWSRAADPGVSLRRRVRAWRRSASEIERARSENFLQRYAARRQPLFV
jgi:hypothetical protein